MLALKSFFNILKNIPLFAIHNNGMETSIILPKQNILFGLNIFKKHIGYKYEILSCISGVDLLNTSYRFSIVYDLFSILFNSRLRIKIFVNEAASVLSSTSVFVNANWWEKEIWDLYGIFFENHPDLRRILTDYGFEGNPLRKDFPLSGFEETKFDISKKRVGYRLVELTQDPARVGISDISFK